MTRRGRLGLGDVIAERFRLVAEIGEGGMGRVFEAEDLRHDRPAALKLISRRLAQDEEFRERFVREAQAAEHANHPHVLPVWDYGGDRGYLYLAGPLCDSDLAALLDEYGRLDIEAALGVVGQIAWALDWAHARGVLHRDVKPENILLVSGPHQPHAYLGDFGMARVASSATLTQAGHFAALSPAYAAPEQWLGERAVPATDEYALAATLYCCLSGHPPFWPCEDNLELRDAHLHRPLPELDSAVDPRLGELAAPLSQGMAKDPQDRYGSCEELIGAIRAATASLPTDPSTSRVETDPEHPLGAGGREGRGHHDPDRILPSTAAVEDAIAQQGAKRKRDAEHVTQAGDERDSITAGDEALSAAAGDEQLSTTRDDVERAPSAGEPERDDQAAGVAAAGPVGRDGEQTGGGEAGGSSAGSWLRRHRWPGAGLLALVAGAIAVVVVLSSGFSKTEQRTPPAVGQRVAGGLGPVPTNRVNGVGNAVVRLNGNDATVSVQTTGLLDNAPHAMHIHAGRLGRCPPPSAAQLHNGHLSIATLNGGPFYGPPLTALTTTGDTSPKSIIAFARFPHAGNIRYTRTIKVSPVVAAYVRQDNAVLVVHGIDYNDNGIYDGTLERSDLKRSLPGESTAPALCGPLVAQPGSGGKNTAQRRATGTEEYSSSLSVPPSAPTWLCDPRGNGADLRAL